jgi:hypothetical protein
VSDKNPCDLGKITRAEWNSQQIMQDGDMEDQETVSFMDLAPHSMTQVPHSAEEVANNMAMDSVSLADFLSRPVLISSVTWAEVDAVGTKITLEPWRLFFDTPTIKYKLNNWAFVRCNLHVRVVFNASPFYYGSSMINWRPLQGLSPSYIYDDGTPKRMIPFSQMPGRVMIEPQHPEDVEMVLPFFWPVNFLRCEKATDFTNMGLLYLNIINALQSANGTVGTGITLKFYAWATEVSLSGPSVGLSMQDGNMDEYGMDGPISKPASAIANIAARLGNIPIIGRFATATQIGASAVGHIAKLFGFTNVPVISDQAGFQPRALPPIATTDIGFPFEKFTVDSKNELTIDHSSVGLDSLDELPVASLVQRESFLTSFSWSSATAADTLLFTSAVTPTLFDSTAVPNQTLYMTPMCWLATMFDYWRGDVIFRFRVVCSKFHRGRLKISYDPDGYAGLNVTTDQSSHLIMTKIVDINEDTNVEFRVPYQQYVAWCSTSAGNTMTPATRRWGSSGFKHVRGETNGSLAITIQTMLTAPVDISVVHVQVYVRGAENMDFASPSTVTFGGLTPAEIQDGEIPVSDEIKNLSSTDIISVSSGKISSPVDHLYLTYMGERIASLRVLLRRQCKIYTHATASDSIQDYVIRSLTLGRIPASVGYTTWGLNAAKGLIVPANTFGFNWNRPNYLSYIAPAFRCNRGSVNWTSNFDMGSEMPVQHFTVIRDKVATNIGSAYSQANIGNFSANNAFWFANSRSTGSGALVANGATSNAANWQMPFYSSRKFAFNDLNSLCITSGEFSTVDYWTAEWSTSGTHGTDPVGAKLHLYAGAGTDFDLMYFLHVPTYGVLSGNPTPA